MEGEKFKNLSEIFGARSKISENPKSTKKKEELFFIDIISNLCKIEAISKIIDSAGISLTRYEDMHFQVIESLLEKQYGIKKTSIILWWIFESLDDEGGVYPLLDEENKKHTIKTPKQLYKFLKRYDGK
jgi:hypothetical protein